MYSWYIESGHRPWTLFPQTVINMIQQPALHYSSGLCLPLVLLKNINVFEGIYEMIFIAFHMFQHEGTDSFGSAHGSGSSDEMPFERLTWNRTLLHGSRDTSCSEADLLYDDFMDEFILMFSPFQQVI